MTSNYKHNPSADTMKQHASVVVFVEFIDGNTMPFYSRDVAYRNDKRIYQNADYWIKHFKSMVETENFGKWRGRLKSAGMFYWNNGIKGEKINQFYADTKSWEK